MHANRKRIKGLGGVNTELGGAKQKNWNWAFRGAGVRWAL